jgi:hypothetical protein
MLLQPPPAACLAGLHGCALGLLVPGAGPSVSRAAALAALERGKVRQSTLGGLPSGPVLARPGAVPGRVTFYVTLPPPGSHHNGRRYPIAVVGPGWDGILESSATRIPGLVSVADVAPTVQALEHGKDGTIRPRADAHPRTTLRRLDARLAAAHDARPWVTILLVVLTLALAAAAALLRLPAAARATVLAPPAVLLGALAVSALGISRIWAVLVVLGAAGAAAAVAAGTRRRALPWAVGAFLATELVVLALRPDVNALAVIGPHPDGGGRFYGITNAVETLLVAPVLAACAVAPGAGMAVLGLLALVTLGWSRAGADGGGVLVLLVALGVLVLRLRGRRLRVPQLAAATAAIVAVALLFVGIDAATGGSSHVTHAVGKGPGSLLGELAHRLNVSWAGATASWDKILLVVSTTAALAFLATRRPRGPTVDALLVALAVSLLVNDTPTDVIPYGALACTTLVVWERLRREPET